MPETNTFDPEEQAALAAYDRPRQNADEWAECLNELRLADQCSGDGLDAAFAEYPEYQTGGVLDRGNGPKPHP
ncbi:hypothetical protein MOQ72_18290 [Saccharopolyspora sp. K220]|uniref:hypothetical protein n=1 Tax=Saccharopolyspora soli TaxID=2926618 RepID=UPI001F574EA3|nr:hypothetical protein [Saccharopolyspora soli]MCI2419395.1 hypothetical protein [Saccharopolyspora soli]